MLKRKKQAILVVMAAAALAMSACASPAPTGFGNSVGKGIGANVGGSQDIKLAREQILQGRIPQPDAFQIEGLYAEHDLPVAEAPAGKTLHLALGLGIAPSLPDEKPVHFVQVGLGSGLTEKDLQRPKLKLAVVADTSGSMEEDNKIAALHQALHQLVGKLKDGDELTLIDFDNDVHVLREFGPVGDRKALDALIDKMDADGGTDIDLGLKKGYEMLSQVQVGPGEERRLILLTDAVPTVGNTSPDSFEGLVKKYSEAGIGLTAFGIGLDFGAQLADVIGSQRGGNYAFLATPTDVKTVFDENFDFLMTPAAYDMELAVEPADGFKITSVYGVRDWKQAEGVYSLKVKTLFFSKNRGAIVLRMEEATEGAAKASAQPLVAKGTLKYIERDGKTPVADTIEAVATGDRPTDMKEAYFAPTGVRKAVALTNEFLAMREAARLYHIEKSPEKAKALLARAKTEMEATQKALKDEALLKEVELLTKLSANMK